jgi:membrane fusion protein
MTETLFRAQAVRATMASPYGGAVFYQPPAVKIFTALVIVVFTVFLLFAFMAQITRTQSAQGYLLPSEGFSRVYSHRSGTLTTLLVAEGDYVRAGDLLALVQEPLTDAEGRLIAETLRTQLEKQMQHVQKQKQLAARRTHLGGVQAQDKLQSITKELELLEEEYVLIMQRLDLADQEYKASSLLRQQQAISLNEHNQKLSSRLAHMQAAMSHMLLIETRRQQALEAAQQLQVLPLQLEDELLTHDSALLQLSGRHTELGATSASAIVAPTDGRIDNILLRPGSQIDTRSPLLSLVPQSLPLEAIIYLPSRALGRLQIGQQVMISYDAFPYQLHGSFAAEIVHIGTAIIDPREFLIPLELNEPVYLVRASLAQQHVENPAVMELRSGMRFSAEIVTSRSTLLQRMLEPLQSLRKRL